MTRINLLPWRAQRRERLKKEFLGILGGVAGAALVVVVLAHSYVNSQIDYQSDRNQYLSRAIVELDKQVKEIKTLQQRRTELKDRMAAIQGLQGTRPVIVRIFDEIVRTLPEGVYFKSLKSAGKTITIQGTAESNNRVSSLMRKLDQSAWFAGPNLRGVKANAKIGEQANDFELTVTVTMPNASKDGEEE